MFPRLIFCFRKSKLLTSYISTQKASISSKIYYKSSFFSAAALSLSICTFGTIYAYQNHQTIVTAAASIASNEQYQCPAWNYSWDGYTTRSVNNSIRTITLVRHGQYIHADSAPDKKLTDLGKEQAKITGKRLKCLGVEYDEIICSKMIRAQQTCDIIANELGQKHKNDVISDGNLNEGCPAKCVPVRNDLRDSGFYDSLDVDSKRMSEAFETYFHRNLNEKNENILIVGHGNCFRYFICRALQIPEEAWLRFALYNCSITKLKIVADGRVSVKAIGDCGHLEKDKITYH